MIVSVLGGADPRIRMGWSVAYLCMAGLMALGVLTIFLSPEPKMRRPPKSMAEAVVGPLTEFLPSDGGGVVGADRRSRPATLCRCTHDIVSLRGMQFVGGYRGGPCLWDRRDHSWRIHRRGLLPRMGLFRALFLRGAAGALNLSFLWLACGDYPVMAVAVESKISPAAWAPRRSWRWSCRSVTIATRRPSLRCCLRSKRSAVSFQGLRRSLWGWPGGDRFLCHLPGHIAGLWLLWYLPQAGGGSYRRRMCRGVRAEVSC